MTAVMWEPPAWLRDAGITYRQLDLWTRRGWVIPSREGEGEGPGYRRIWSEPERRIVRVMARLVRAGIGPAAAAGIAREAVKQGRRVVAVVKVSADVTIAVSTE
jgi:hypothetical protein